MKMSSSSFAVVVVSLWWTILFWTNRCCCCCITTSATTTNTTTTAERHHPIWFASSVTSSSYRQQQQDRYDTNQLRLKFKVVHHHQHVLRSWPPPPPQARILQQQQNNVTTAAPALCNDTTGSINFPDAGLNFQLFGSTTSDLYESTCFCEEDDNEDEVIAQLEQLDFVDDVVTFVDSFNTLVGQLMFSSNYSCTNECSSCFMSLNGTVCGFFSVEETSNVQTGKGNFTIEQILAGPTNEDIAALVDTAALYMVNCVQYTGDAYGNSQICFITDLMSLPDETEPVFCNITFNDVLCDYCVVPAVAFNSSDAGECIVADCSNVDATYGTMIDTCENVGVSGPFQFLALRDEVNATTFTLGTCNGGGMDVPVATPTVAAPSNTGPTSTDTTTGVPTSVPVLISEPTDGENTTAPTQVPAVTAPVLSVPVLLPLPTSDTTRRTRRSTHPLMVLVAMLTSTFLSMIL